MNIYAIEAYGSRGGACAIVAAMSEAEALQTVQAKAVSTIWDVFFDQQSRVKTLLTHIVAEPGLLHFYETGE
jgi:hypothetical protein